MFAFVFDSSWGVLWNGYLDIANYLCCDAALFGFLNPLVIISHEFIEKIQRQVSGICGECLPICKLKIQKVSLSCRQENIHEWWLYNNRKEPWWLWYEFLGPMAVVSNKNTSLALPRRNRTLTERERHTGWERNTGRERETRRNTETKRDRQTSCERDQDKKRPGETKKPGNTERPAERERPADTESHEEKQRDQERESDQERHSDQRQREIRRERETGQEKQRKTRRERETNGAFPPEGAVLSGSPQSGREGVI